MDDIPPRYEARRRSDGQAWCVIDRVAGGYALPTVLLLDRLPEDQARLFCHALNQMEGGAPAPRMR